jgi:hypothetical protein
LTVIAAQHVSERGPRTEERFVKGHAIAELIGAGIETLAPKLFRRHVRQSPDDRARLGNSGWKRAGCRILTAGGVRGLLGKPRQPEVHDAHRTVAPDHDVLGLEVAVDDARRVRRRQAAPRRDEDVQHLAPTPRLGAQPRVDGLALDELHRDVNALADRPGVVNGDDVGVRQPRDRARLTQQARAPLGRAGAGFADDLQRDPPVQIRVIRRVHLTHSPASNRAEDLVPVHP